MRLLRRALHSRRAVFGLAAVFAALVFVARLIVHDPREPVLLFLVVPTGLIAAETGVLGGLISAAVASALVVVWDLTTPQVFLTAYGYLARWTIFFLSGLTIGMLTAQRKDVEQQLRDVALTDEVTGIPNRRYFEEEARRHLDFIRRYGRRGALFVFDIDDFKMINDSLGHQAGDAALTKVASATKDHLRTTDIVGRIGGDEFAILLPEMGPREAEVVAAALLELISGQQVATDGRTMGISSSIGIVIFSADDDLDLRNLLHAADQAMYEAKRSGGGCFVLLDDPWGTTTAGAEADDRSGGEV